MGSFSSKPPVPPKNVHITLWGRFHGQNKNHAIYTCYRDDLRKLIQDLPKIENLCKLYDIHSWAGNIYNTRVDNVDKFDKFKKIIDAMVEMFPPPPPSYEECSEPSAPPKRPFLKGRTPKLTLWARKLI
jgi:hypothetical protein